jgi:hypothetical protein
MGTSSPTDSASTFAAGGEHSEVIRPAAVLESSVAARVVSWLRASDVSHDGVWNASASLWQRYDRTWDGPGGTRGTSSLVGSIAVMYDAPNRYEVTIYKVSITPVGVAAHWTVTSLCEDALAPTGLTLEVLPRAELFNAPRTDPFRV